MGESLFGGTALGDGSAAADGVLQSKLRNWDYVGKCYDVLLTDPMDLNTGRKKVAAFTFDTFENISDDTASKPVGTEYDPYPGGSYDHRVVEISSLYDFRTHMTREGSLNVSDPTGEAFSASLSESFKRTREDTEKNESVVTFTSERVTLWELRVRDDDQAPYLTAELQQAVADLPTAVTPTSHAAFLARFGTHFAQRVVFGGRLNQRISVSRHDYEGFLSEGVDVSADVQATFEIAKAGARYQGSDSRDSRFTTAKSLSVESITFVGGNAPQSLFDMWALTVKDLPAPVIIDFEPLYSLLTAERFPDDGAIAARRQALLEATESYLSSHGVDTSKEVIRSGDTVVLSVVVGGHDLRLRAAERHVVASVPADGSTGAPDSSWTVVAADHPGSTDPLDLQVPVALRNVARQGYLDSTAGGDDTYSPGDGLTGLGRTTPDRESARWTMRLASGQGRRQLVDGDYVQLVRCWRDPDGDAGLLLCDAKAPARDGEVFSFGRSGQRGTVWRIDRL